MNLGSLGGWPIYIALKFKLLAINQTLQPQIEGCTSAYIRRTANVYISVVGEGAVVRPGVVRSTRSIKCAVVNKGAGGVISKVVGYCETAAIDDLPLVGELQTGIDCSPVVQGAARCKDRSDLRERAPNF